MKNSQFYNFYKCKDRYKFDAEFKYFFLCSNFDQFLFFEVN